MTPQEALYWYNHNGATIEQEIEVESFINEALEKQIPKKPRVTTYQYICNGKEESMFLKHCPNCFDNLQIGYFDSIVDKDSAYCRRCGQRLDWSENDE